MIYLDQGYHLLDGVIVDTDEEPVELPNGCNCDMDYLCPNPQCIDRSLRDLRHYLCRPIPQEWTEYLEAWKTSKELASK